MRRLYEQIIGMTGSRPRLLVVDDDPVTVTLLRSILQSKADIVAAANPAEALELCRAVQPDLVLLDIALGSESGFDLCHEMQLRQECSAKPVIFISASVNEADEERAFELGAVDFIRKPISPYIAESRVLTHLALQLQAVLLKQLAHSDGLTGVRNRRIFDQELEREWRECMRDGTPLSLVMIDIDHFKKFNDNYGHLEGDACLRRVAAAIQATLSRPADCVARYGGEEFACILPDTGFEGALAVAENIRAGIAALGIAHRDGATARHTVSASLGVATCFPDSRQDRLALLAEADHQLYRAKELGRDRVCGTMQGPGYGGPVAVAS